MSARPAGREGMSHVHARPARYFMNIASTLLLAVAMSTDAFAAAVGKGAALNRPHLREALRTGLVFGLIEAATPLIGWARGPMSLHGITGSRSDCSRCSACA
jgi:hypothetical protein